MESENESNAKESESIVKSLQSSLFPTQQLNTGSYFSNFLVKSSYEDDDDKFKVKESSSKEWFPGTKEVAFTLQPARWPTECQVLDERIQHINYVPPTFEPYNVVTGNEIQLKPSGDECGIIVYQYTPMSAVNYFSRSSVAGSKYLLSANISYDDNTLKFESRFESGNLARAIMITPSYYELHLRSDMYTNRHMQWFYFRISNTKKGCLYRFSITNCSKDSSLYTEGMKPLMYSTKDSQLHSIGWRRCGQNITYYSNDNVTTEDADQQMTYTFTFTVKFPHDDDEVYLAHCYPYTYSDLQDYLQELSSHPVKSSFTSVRLLCKSLAGNNVYYVTITSPANSGENKKKRAVVITARVHPGETPSSWIMQGILDFLTGDSGPAKELRDKFIFKLVPMLNPDGVIVGNNRCSLSAKDLNRQYRTVIRDSYPSIWYTKLMVRRLLEECGVAMYCDLHAHSRKHNIFVYGCENRRGADRKLQEQVFPLMLHKNTADKFSFESCKFRIQKAKEGTGRVVMWMMGIANSYTMEASFAGSNLGNRADTHFNTQDLEQMGRSFCQTLLDFYDEEPQKERLRVKIIERLVKEGSNADEPTNIRLSDYSSDEGDTTSSSDEVGRDDDDVVVPLVPPPSPVAVTRKPKTRSSPSKLKQSRSPSLQRKPLPICKATLKLSLSEKESDYTSSSSDEYQFVDKTKERAKSLTKKRKKVVQKKKKRPQDISESEMRLKSQSEISIFDFVPMQAVCSQTNTNTKPRTNQLKTIKERKNEISRQLAEVQAKLYTLKNKLWFGVGNGDAPISWGSRNIYISTDNNRPRSPQKKKTTKKTLKKQQDIDKQRTGTKEKTNNKTMDQREKKTNLNGLRRQAAVEWPNQNELIKIRKSKSLPETVISLEPSAKNKNKSTTSGDEEKKDKSKKKKEESSLRKPRRSVTLKRSRKKTDI